MSELHSLTFDYRSVKGTEQHTFENVKRPIFFHAEFWHGLFSFVTSGKNLNYDQFFKKVFWRNYNKYRTTKRIPTKVLQKTHSEFWLANFSFCFKIVHLGKKIVTVTNWWIQTSFKPVSRIYEVSVWIEFQTKTSKQLPKQERIIFSGNKESFVTSWLHRNKCTCVCMHTHSPSIMVGFYHLNKPVKMKKEKKKMEQMLRMWGQGHVEDYTSFEYKATVSGSCLLKK